MDCIPRAGLNVMSSKNVKEIHPDVIHMYTPLTSEDIAKLSRELQWIKQPILESNGDNNTVGNTYNGHTL